MSLLDMYRRNAARKRSEIAQLQNDRVKETAKVADLSGKIQRASEAMNRTKTVSTIQSKLRDIERYQRDAASAEKRAAGIDAKIAQKHRELDAEEKKVAREEESAFKKRQQEAERQARDHQRNMTQIRSTLSQHDRIHLETRTALERLQQLPEKITVTFFAANPVDQQQLRLDEEARAIAETIRKSKHRDAVRFESCWAVRPMDVLQALNEHEPAVVHFSGHGSDQDEIVFQDASGAAKLVSKEAIVQTMMASSEGIRLVFFNTCYSRNQAEAVVEHVEAAIGMNTGIGDKAARVFASQFYSSIGFGLSVKKAFEQAKALLMLEGIPEQDTPELFIHEGLDPDALVIVKPKAPEAEVWTMG